MTCPLRFLCFSSCFYLLNTLTRSHENVLSSIYQVINTTSLYVRGPVRMFDACMGKVANPARGQQMIFFLSPFEPDILVSRDGFGSPVRRQPAHVHTQAEYGAYLRDSSRFPRRRTFIHLKPPYIRHRVSPEFIGSRSCVPMVFTAEIPPAQGQ